MNGMSRILKPFSLSIELRIEDCQIPGEFTGNQLLSFRAHAVKVLQSLLLVLSQRC